MIKIFFKNTIRLACSFVLAFYLLMTASAVETHVFRSGLMLPQCHSYGRAAVYFDQLAF